MLAGGGDGTFVGNYGHIGIEIQIDPNLVAGLNGHILGLHTATVGIDQQVVVAYGNFNEIPAILILSHDQVTGPATLAGRTAGSIIPAPDPGIGPVGGDSCINCIGFKILSGGSGNVSFFAGFLHQKAGKLTIQVNGEFQIAGFSGGQINITAVNVADQFRGITGIHAHGFCTTVIEKLVPLIVAGNFECNGCSGSQADDFGVYTIGNLGHVTGRIGRIPIPDTGDAGTYQSQTIQIIQINGVIRSTGDRAAKRIGASGIGINGAVIMHIRHFTHNDPAVSRAVHLQVDSLFVGVIGVAGNDIGVAAGNLQRPPAVSALIHGKTGPLYQCALIIIPNVEINVGPMIDRLYGNGDGVCGLCRNDHRQKRDCHDQRQQE